MSLNEIDNRFLRRALDLAHEGAAFASPNPAVGCVLTQRDVAIGEGAHDYAQRDHAEIVALKAATAAGHQARGATAYVTLEPCSHHGRTGPCADALIAAGIARCVIAAVDPNPVVRGGGMAKLRDAGVEVVLLGANDPLAVEARRANDAFAFAIQRGRPFATLKAAVSADGFLAPPPHTRSGAAAVWLTGEAARKDVQQLRHAADAVLTGIGTVLADDPLLTDRTERPRRRKLLRVVLDSQLRTPLDSRLVAACDDDLLIVCAKDAPRAEEKALTAAGAAVLRLPSLVRAEDGEATYADPWFVMQTLFAFPARSVLLEGGSALNGAFLEAGLVDRVVLYRTEVNLGAGSVPFALDGPTPEALVKQLSSVATKHFANAASTDTRVAGYLHDPWEMFTGHKR